MKILAAIILLLLSTALTAHPVEDCDCLCEVEYEVQAQEIEEYEPDVKRGAVDPDFGDREQFLRIIRGIENVKKYEEK